VEFASTVFHRERGRLWAIADALSVRSMEEAFSLLGLPRGLLRRLALRIHPEICRGDVACSSADGPDPSRRQHAEDAQTGARLDARRQIRDPRNPGFQTVQARRLWSASGIGYMAFHQKNTERFKWDYFLTSPERCLLVEMGRRADLPKGRSMAPPDFSGAQGLPTSKAREPRRDRRHRRHERVLDCDRDELDATRVGTEWDGATPKTPASQGGRSCRLGHRRFLAGHQGSEHWQARDRQEPQRLAVLFTRRMRHNCVNMPHSPAWRLTFTIRD
jgi:hypothetical protein